MNSALKNTLRFNRKYFLISMGILCIEILIGVYANDNFIRPYGGDFLVVIGIYCFFRAFFKLPVLPVACSVLLFSYIVEWLQYIKLADRLELGRHSLARILLGDYFTWTDIGCYSMGILTVLAFEKLYESIVYSRA